MFFKEYQTDFFGDNEILDFIESNLSKRVKKYRANNNLRVTSRRPIKSVLVESLRESHRYMVNVIYDKRDCGLWIFCDGIELSYPRWHEEGSIEYKKFVEKENLLMDVTYHLLHGMSYERIIDMAKLTEVEDNLLIQNCYLIDPAREYNKLFFCKKYSEEDNKIYLDFCKANKNIVENVDPEVPYTLPDLIERRLFNADKERLIKLIGSGDLEIPWYWHLTKYEYAALTLPEIQRRLKAGDESVFCKLEEMFHLLDLDDVVKYKEWLIKSRNFGE